LFYGGNNEGLAGGADGFFLPLHSLLAPTLASLLLALVP
jgi:hypothetical protein